MLYKQFYALNLQLAVPFPSVDDEIESSGCFRNSLQLLAYRIGYQLD